MSCAGRKRGANPVGLAGVPACMLGRTVTQPIDALVYGMYSSFREFYPFYLGEHTDRRCRRMHFLGSWLVLAAVVVAIATRNPWWLIAAPICGYGCAWIGHFAFERNKPATFRHPVYSLMGDWAMFADVLRGRVKL